MNGADETIYRALLPRLRLMTARLELIGLPAGEEDALADWLKRLPMPTAVDDQPIVELGLSVSADFDRWRWQASGDPAAFIPMMGSYLAEMGATRPDLDLLSLVGAEIEPALLGYWLEARSRGTRVGWRMPVPLSLDQARLALPSHEATRAMLDWAESSGVDVVAGLSRTIGTVNPWSEALLPLPHPDDVEEQVFLGVQLFERLGARRPPDEALSLLMNLDHGGLAVSVWLSEEGPVKVGLLAADPRLALTIELCQLAGLSSPDSLAAFEGIIGVEGPTSVECQTRADGFMVETHYHLDPDESLRAIG